MAKLESAVIVRNEHGSVATLRFDNPRLDTFISSSNRNRLFMLIESYIKKVTNGPTIS